MSRPVVTALSPESIEDFKTVDDVVFIAYISLEDDEARQSLSAVAQMYRQEFTFGLISHQEVIKAENIESPTVVGHVNEDRETRFFSSFSEPQSLDKFVSEASRLVIGELTRQNQPRLLDVSDSLKICVNPSDTAFRSEGGPWSTCSERPQMIAQNFVGRSMTSRRAIMTL